MSQLKTTWLCIATEGDTVDGRIIERQDIIDAVELYNPALYTALIWPEHNHDADPMGEVAELMAEDDETGTLHLFAKLIPFINLIEANSRNDFLFTSVEFTPDGNFRGTGKSYLEGLGVTNEPASVGTTRLKFYSNQKRNRKMPLDTSWRKRFNIADPEPTPEPQPAPADDAKLQELAQALAAAENKIAELEAKLAETQQEVTDVQEDVDTVKEVVDTEDFAKLRDNLPEITKNFSKLNQIASRTPSSNPQGNKNERFNFL